MWHYPLHEHIANLFVFSLFPKGFGFSNLQVKSLVGFLFAFIGESLEAKQPWAQMALRIFFPHLSNRNNDSYFRRLLLRLK